MEDPTNLSRPELLKLVQAYAQSWLAHDGCWFLAAEEKYGIDTAMELILGQMTPKQGCEPHTPAVSESAGFQL
ncbi:MAG: DUF6125 family protein [Anaerolineae bacterium]|nr:DUF6125 family protein [Anaerolineae bacterium]